MAKKGDNNNGDNGSDELDKKSKQASGDNQDDNKLSDIERAKQKMLEKVNQLKGNMKGLKVDNKAENKVDASDKVDNVNDNGAKKKLANTNNDKASNANDDTIKKASVASDATRPTDKKATKNSNTTKSSDKVDNNKDSGNNNSDDKGSKNKDNDNKDSGIVDSNQPIDKKEPITAKPQKSNIKITFKSSNNADSDNVDATQESNDSDGASAKTVNTKQRPKDIRPIDNTKLVKVQVEDEMKKSFIAYAMAVNISRAIPDVRDGLKPVHRRILYSMGELNLYSDKQYRKCARIVGDVLGKYHPHGDSAVYQALVRLAQPFSIRYPLVDGHGNFGSVDGDPAAAQRYTEAKLTKIAGEMLRDIDKETVDYYPNFDDTLEQPTVLPARIPNLLVNGSDGIAVGMATNIPPHNLNEVINGIFALINNPEITVDELMQYVPAPDYPTGGIIMGRGNIRHAYKTGHGGVVIRARATIEEYGHNKDGLGGRQMIVVTELPFQVNKALLIEFIADMVKDKRIEGIANVNDESDRDGLRVVIEIKRDAQANVVLNQLYKHTNLQVSNGITFLALVNNEPKILNLKEMLYYYLEHQKEVVVRRTRYDLEKAEERSHILQGLVIALANIDRVIAIIKGSRDKFEASEQLVAEFYLTDKQANAILEMRLSRLTSLEVEQLNREYEELQLTIADLKNILAVPQRVLDIIVTELTEIQNKYGDDRRSEIEINYDEINVGDMIDVEDVVISMTHYGYIKRYPTTEFKAQKRGGKGQRGHKPKEEDFVEEMFVSSTHSDIMFFSNKGKVYSIKGYEIPEASKIARGRAIINLLNLEEGEKINAIIALAKDQKGYLMMATKYALVKKTSLDEFTRINKGGKIAIKLLEDDELISVQLTNGRDEILLASSEGKCIRFSEEDVRPLSRTAQGVRSIKLNKERGDYCVDMTVLKANSEILTISANGYGKRTDVDDYRLQSRAGKGILAGKFDNRTGPLVNLKQINPEDDIMVVADNGIIIRMKSKDISKISRNTIGVRIMRMKNMGKVVSFAVTPPEAEEISDSDETSDTDSTTDSE